MFVENDGLLLEGNKLDSGSFLGGAAFMSDQKPIPSGCMWKFIPSEVEGYYNLTTMFVEKDNLFLEGNKLGENSTLKGAAFMSDQKPIPSGCCWKIVPSDNPDYVLLTTLFVEKDNLFLEGNKLGEKANTRLQSKVGNKIGEKRNS